MFNLILIFCGFFFFFFPIIHCDEFDCQEALVLVQQKMQEITNSWHNQ